MITPSNGVLLDTLHTLEAVDWVAPQSQGLTYTFAYYPSSDLSPQPREVVLTKLLNAPTANVYLPSGQWRVVVYVGDSAGSISRFVSPTTVNVDGSAYVGAPDLLSKVARASSSLLVDASNPVNFDRTSQIVTILSGKPACVSVCRWLDIL